MKVTGIGLTTTKEAHESELDVKFAKVGNSYLNTWNIERCLFIDDEISVTMDFGSEYSFIIDFDGDEDVKMAKVARTINDSSHDIIYLEAAGKTGEGAFDEDQASNLLYRQWLESMAHNDSAHVDEPLHKQFFKKSKIKK
jgi:hypothetical protein